MKTVSSICFGAKYSFKKMNIIVSSIRKFDIEKALEISLLIGNKGYLIIYKLIKSAIYNICNLGLKIENISNYIIYVNKGKIVKKKIMKAKGSSSLIRKRKCNIFLNVYFKNI